MLKFRLLFLSLAPIVMLSYSSFTAAGYRYWIYIQNNLPFPVAMTVHSTTCINDLVVSGTHYEDSKDPVLVYPGKANTITATVYTKHSGYSCYLTHSLGTLIWQVNYWTLSGIKSGQYLGQISFSFNLSTPHNVQGGTLGTPSYPIVATSDGRSIG